MLDFVPRSRSHRSGAVAHHQGTLVGERGHRTSSFGSAKQRTTSSAVQKEGTPSSSVPPSDVSDDAGHRLLHATSAAPYSSLPMMQERPRTSSGPGPGHAFANANKALEDWDKRKSRDDSHISRKRGTARRERERFDTYQVPIRGSPPSPKESGEEASPVPRVHVRTQTPESISDNNGIITIGMAIGSPSHPSSSGYGETTPQPLTWAASASPAPTLQQPSPVLPAALPQEPKSGRWRLFGRNKGKRSKPEMARMTTTIPTTTTTAAIEPSPLAGETYVAGPRDGGLDRSFTDRKAPRHKPIIIRSQTEPVADSTRGATSQPERLLRADIGPPRTRTKPEGPYLDVEIPDITMERYSVMFGGLLQSQGSASSLLARRQATADRLKSIGERAAVVEDFVESNEPNQVWRSANSPGREKSPRLSLFPVPPEATGITTASPSSARLRSATVPAGLPAHPKERLGDKRQTARDRSQNQNQNQDQNQNQSQSQPQVGSKSAQLPPPLATKTAARASKKPTGKRRAGTQQERQLKVSTSAQDLTPRAPRFSPDQSSLILDSPTESPKTDNEEIRVRERLLKPAVFEPKWEMVSPPPPGSAASAPSLTAQAPDNGRAASAASVSREDVRRPSASSSSSPPAFASKTQNHAKKPSDDSLDESALQAAVQASITRQISISQKQRDMLGANIRNAEGRRVRPSRPDRSDRRRGGGSPVEQAAVPGMTATATSTSTSGKPSPVAVAVAELASNERLVTTKTATPTLVTPPESSGGSPLAQHRKSERIVLEGG